MTAPLTGVRVVELTTAWAGPMAGRILAHLGADVVHVEHATRTDLWRQHGQAIRPRLYPDGDPGARPYNRNALFNSQNIGKRSLSLDIKAPRGLALMRDLLARMDVLLCNFAPGALDRAGLGFAGLQAANEQLVVVEMPAYGNEGPSSRAGAVGMTMEMASGMAGLTGYADGPPACTGPHFMDPIGGYNAAAAILTALVKRRATGRGQRVEVPQVEAAMQFIGAELLGAAETGCIPARNGNRVAWAAPHDAYQAAGHDQWVAVAVLDDAAWARLCTLVGDPALFDEALRRLPGRLAAADQVDAALSRWTARHDKAEAARLLQAAGVAAAPVNDGGDVLGSEFLRAQDFFTELTHPEAGTHAYPSVPIHLGRMNPTCCAAPALGQHTDEVLAETLGLSPLELRRLQMDGITGNEPPT